MRLLIDGYNLMHAAGHMRPRLGPDGLRKVRHRFLNELSEILDPVDAHQTTIVFDATDPPPHLDTHSRHKGMTIYFAVDESDADERIEALIQSHPDPKRLTVVSSDNRIKLAATRRRAKASTCDDFLTHLDRLKALRVRKDQPVPAPPPERPSRVSESDSLFWQEQFREVEELEEFREVRDHLPMVTEDEIARIAREVAKEQGFADWSFSKGRKPPGRR